MSKTSSLLQLWSYSDDEVISNLSKAKDGILKTSYRIQNSKSYGFSKIPIESIETKGGLYGPKIILQQLCRDWDRIFTNMWCIPPFLPKIPSQGSNGIVGEVLSGLCLETCVKWGISPFNSVYHPKRKIKKPKSKDHPFEKLIVEPTKGEIFENFPYPDSDEEEQNEEQNEEKIENKSKKPQLTQEYPWNITSPGKIQLEVVYKYLHDIPSQIDEVCNLFTSEIEYIIQYMSSNINWSINQIRVPISKTSSPDDQKVLIYPISRLRTGDEKFKQSFRKRVNKVGLCWIDAAVLLVDPSNRDSSDNDNSKYGIMKFEQFINIFKSNNLNNSNQQEVRTEIQNSSPRSGISDRNKFINDYLGSETERIVDGLSGSYEIKSILQPQVKIYVPITIRVNLLASIRGFDIPITSSEYITSRNVSLLSSEIKKLTIGKSETIARLTSSTLWFTEEGAIQIWSFCKETQSLLNCYNYESKRHLLYSKQFYSLSYYVEAYERLCLSTLLSKQTLQVLGTIKSITKEFTSPYLKLTASQIIAAMLRMIHGLPGLVNDVLQSISTIRFLFQSEITRDGVGNNSIHTLGFAFTIVRHISYKIRIILMSSHNLHFHGGGYLILLKLKELEETLHLGQLRLFNMKQGAESTKISVKKFQGYINILPSTLPEFIVTSSSSSSTTTTTSTNIKNPEFEFSQSLFSPAVVVRNIPHNILSEIESYMRYLSISLSRDVNKNIFQFNDNISTIFHSTEIDLSLEEFIHEIMNPSTSLQQQELIPQTQFQLLGKASTFVRQQPLGNLTFL